MWQADQKQPTDSFTAKHASDPPDMLAIELSPARCLTNSPFPLPSVSSAGAFDLRFNVN
jgi:hypothetical protein